MPSYLDFSHLNEAKLSAADRKGVDDEDFGIPSQRRYPMPDKPHVLAAIRFFNKVDPEHEEELARNIKKKMREYGIPSDTVGPTNRLRKYL